jgi:N-methylhydantoinase A
LSTKTPIRIAVDIGGTFTDLQIYDSRGGQAVAYKTPTTPSDPSIGFMTGVREASEKFGFALSDVGLVMHGTTIATNATLENKLAKGALVTTRGFTDVLEIGRHVRRDIYTLKAETRRVLVPRHRRHGITERMRADGSVETPLAVFEIEALAETLRQDSVEAVAICLLNAYANPAHERALKAHLEKTVARCFNRPVDRCRCGNDGV